MKNSHRYSRGILSALVFLGGLGIPLPAMGKVTEVSVSVDRLRAEGASLQGMVQDALAQDSSAAAVTRFKIAPGVYRNQYVFVSAARAGRLEFVGEGSGVVFDGGGKGTWLRVKSDAGALFSVAVTGLTIRNYETAISLEGNREDPKLSLSQNEIFGNRFENIGGRAKRVSTAGIRFVNITNSMIDGNIFINLGNESKCGLFHAVYLAHYSSHNVIKNNRFSARCGDPIRVRDQSNDNQVVQNTFAGFTGMAVVSEWHCDKSVRGDCTKSGSEGLSVRNIGAGNQVR